MPVLGRGWGKLLLFGEHAAVYGHPAVGISLENCTTVELEMDRGSGWRFPGIQDSQRLEKLLLRYEELLPSLREQGMGTVRITSSIPREVGFGSSAALCVALSSALSAQLGGKVEREAGDDEGYMQALWSLAHRGEATFHGTPSGIDTGLSLFRGLHRFLPHPPQLPEIEKLPGFPLCLVVGAVQRSGNTGTLVGGLRKQVEAGDTAVLGRLDRLGDLAGEAIRLFRGESTSKPQDLGELARQAQSELKSLELSTPQLDDLLKEGEKAGAVGGKLSGAGGGGAYFLICETLADALAVKERIAHVMERRPGFDGGLMFSVRVVESVQK